MNCSVFEMDENINCTAYNIKLDKEKNIKDKTICKNYYNEKKTKTIL